MEDIKEHDHHENHEHNSSEYPSDSKGKTEMRIDNNPDDRIEKAKDNVKKNPWILVTFVLVAVVVVLGVLMFRGGGDVGVTGNVISGEDAGEVLVEYLNARTGGGVEYLAFKDLGNIYEVSVNFQDQEIPVYVTKDGEYFVQGAVPMTGDFVAPIDVNPDASQQQQQQDTNTAQQDTNTVQQDADTSQQTSVEVNESDTNGSVEE